VQFFVLSAFRPWSNFTMARFANRLVHFFKRDGGNQFDALQPLFEDPRLTERLQVTCLLVNLYYERKAQEVSPEGCN
jgi:hypothetical protein